MGYFSEVETGVESIGRRYRHLCEVVPVDSHSKNNKDMLAEVNKLSKLYSLF